tara:strand:+ start:663 stop:881 length:219 start_codon:yes stop_codon:yes gene_type:complete
MTIVFQYKYKKVIYMNEKIKNKLKEYDTFELSKNIKRELNSTLGTIILPIQQSGSEEFNLSSIVRPNDEPSL